MGVEEGLGEIVITDGEDADLQVFLGHVEVTTSDLLTSIEIILGVLSKFLLIGLTWEEENVTDVRLLLESLLDDGRGNFLQASGMKRLLRG